MVTPEQREATVTAGVERAHSVRSPGHWSAPTRDLVNGWHTANAIVTRDTDRDAVFAAAMNREHCAMVLTERGVTGLWTPVPEKKPRKRKR